MKGSVLERFAQEARIQLQKEVRTRLNLILKGDASIDLIENSKAVNALNKHLEELKGNEDALVEEVAYTWFNRISAIRFMDASGYNSTLIVSPVEGKTLPEILSEALSGIIDENVVSNIKDQERIHGLVDGLITSGNPQTEIYRILLVASCNYLNNSLPLLFEKIEDYTDLLLPDDLLSSESIITKTVNAINSEDVSSVEIIGWLYQYYISEKKDQVFKSFKDGNKAGKDEIPAATQLFTPEWIVRYLVENSLGRLWMLNHPESKLKSKMKYYIEPRDKETDFIRLESPEEIKVLDPCCGSGHMLTYAFDLLFDIYTECGYTDNDAVKHIVEDNLYGIEIDKRAGQLAYFAIMMKARERSRRILKKGIKPNICILSKVVFEEDELPNVINLFDNPSLQVMDLMNDFKDADILGSLITPSLSDIASLKNSMKVNSNSDELFSEENTLRERVNAVLDQAEYLTRKYHVVVTNPPYMGNGKACDILANWIKQHYLASKADLYSVFISRNESILKVNGYCAMVTMQGWMFLSGFEEFRIEFLRHCSLLSLIHIGTNGFDSISGEVVSAAAFIFTTQNSAACQFIDVTEGKTEKEKSQKLVDIIQSKRNGYHVLKPDLFSKLPSSQISYWLSKAVLHCFMYPQLNCFLSSGGRIKTHDNESFMRCSWEINNRQVTNYLFVENGGKYRKWSGGIIDVIKWDEESKEYYAKHSGLMKESYIKKNGITWPGMSKGAYRIKQQATGHTSSSPCLYPNSDISADIVLYLLGLLNSNISNVFLDAINPTLTKNPGDVSSIPIKISESFISTVKDKVCFNVSLSKTDWDSFETSWDFSIHPLLDKNIIEIDGFAFEDDQELLAYLGDDEYNRIFKNGIDDSRPAWSPVEYAYLRYKDWANKAFFHLKKNEEELNRIFIDIYGLQDELTPEEDDSMVSVHRIFDSKSEIPESMRKGQYALTKEDVIKSFVSYFVGCMFGRYDVSRPGLAYAGGNFDISSYTDFVPDNDNVIPVLGDSWFKNDAETYFIKFVEKVFGHESLNENLKFIENALGKSIREYFYKDFYKDHLKTYQKRPIYWMFSSPKGYFQALVYMHRYNENTANVVLDYLRQFRDKIRLQIKLAEDAGETKKKVEYENIDRDLNDYEMNTLYPLAIQHLVFDLDDGVKVNYQKLGNALKTIK